MKKLLSILLTVLLAFALMTPAAMADDPDLTGQIVILHTNDVHSRIGTYEGGELKDSTIASVAEWKDYYESLGAGVLLLDAGDTLHGFPIANINEGSDIIDIMETAGYDAMAPGNHDFNYGTDRLIELKGEASFPILSCNLTKTVDSTNPLEGSKIFTLGSKKVAVVGVSTPETKTKAHPNNTLGYDFGDGDKDGTVTAAELAACIQFDIDAQKDAGADYVIVLGHLGIDTESAPWRSTDIIPLLNSVDIFVDGHSHSNITEIVKDAGGEDVVLTSAGQYMEQIGYININGGNITTDKIGNNAQVQKKDDVTFDRVESKFAAIEPQLSNVVGNTTVLLDGNRAPGVRTKETNLGDLAADALRVIGEADCALTNGGGIRTSLEIGDITYGQLNSVFPFGNIVTTIEVTGQDIVDAIKNGTKSLPAASGGFPQVSGIEYKVTIDDGVVTVSDVKVAGAPVDLNKTYKLATNDFTAAGGDGFTMFNGKKVVGYYGAMDEALVTYMKNLPNQQVGSEYAKAQGRIKILVVPNTADGAGENQWDTVTPAAPAAPATSVPQTADIPTYIGFVMMLAAAVLAVGVVVKKVTVK